ncbi:MAG: ECF-type sigma factor [Xanthomonadales bacterium]|nr:ECF-type sigma factor [Xanthomonadales bacterium]
MSVAVDDITRVFQQLLESQTGSSQQASALLYADLKRMARRIGGRFESGETLRTTALLHEAYLRLAGVPEADIGNREQFFALAATVMHRIAVDHVRMRKAAKRGGDVQKVSFEEAAHRSSEGDPDDLILGLDMALQELSAFAPELARLVELLFFVGISQQDVATMRGVSERTVRREWRKARAWLYRFMSDPGDQSSKESANIPSS